MNREKYRCSQSALYGMGHQIVLSLSENLAAFSQISTKYHAGFVEELKNEITTIQNMPDLHVRNAEASIVYNRLCKSLAEAIHHWRMLKGYIRSVFPITQREIRLDEAGASYYSKAMLLKWPQAAALLQAGKLFIENHHHVLDDGLNMPKTFPDIYNQAFQKFEQELSNYFGIVQQHQVARQNKIDANNQLYAKLVKICYDGKLVLSHSEALKEQFNITALKRKTKG